MYAVLAGRVKLVRTSPAGKELLLHLVEEGQTFAEAALFGKATYPATALVVEDVRLWCLPRDRLVELLRRSPDLALALLASMAQWTRRLAAKLEQLTQRRVEERLAVFLLGRAEGEIEAGTTIPLRDPRHLIAAQIGTAPEVLSRALRRLEEEGVAEFAATHARVLEPARLRDLARGTSSRES
jgi:CRP/FNR family transcriptional regulator